jgi:hypothetical protein
VSAPNAVAELIADRGEAASDREFFRSAAFLEAEGVTHTLRIEAGEVELLAPLIVRSVGAGPELDATSPYGYPGLIAAPGVRVDPAAIDFAPTRLISLFLRHRLGDPPLSGASERSVVQLADPALARKSRMSDRQQIRRNLRRGYQLRVVPGPRTSPSERAGFLTAYEQTMRRTGAARRYFFGVSYFDRILSSERTWLALAHTAAGEVAAASIAAASDRALHYYLSGSSDSHLGDSPMKNVLATLIELAAELGVPLNLGGGIRRGDQLEEFKRGFANREQPWYTSEIVCDRDAYQRLSGPDNAGTGFFPAYRS